jgi:hypothetical protein
MEKICSARKTKIEGEKIIKRKKLRFLRKIRYVVLDKVSANSQNFVPCTLYLVPCTLYLGRSLPWWLSRGVQRLFSI